MEGRIHFPSFVLLVTLCLASGCGQDDKSASSEAATGRGSTAEASLGAAKKRAASDTADAAVLAVIDGLKENRLDAFWDFFPASYQKDLNDLVHTFAERMDAELWNKSVAVVRKLAQALKAKKDFFAAARARKEPTAGPGPSAEELAKIAAERATIADLLETQADLLETLLDSDLSDLEKLKTADGGKFLAVTGHRLLVQLRAIGQDPFAGRLGLFSDMKVTLVSATGDVALLTFAIPGATAADRAFVRVEGKWIPQDLADDWLHTMGESNAWLSTRLLRNLEDNKPQLLAWLSAVDESLEGLSAATTEEQFMVAMAAAEESLKPFAPLVASLTGSGPEEEPAEDEESPDQPVELVTVIVQGMLRNDVQDDLRDRLHAVTDDSGRAVGEITGDDEATIFKVGPVQDVEAFARRLDFLKVTNVDAKTRVVTAVPKK